MNIEDVKVGDMVVYMGPTPYLFEVKSIDDGHNGLLRMNDTDGIFPGLGHSANECRAMQPGDDGIYPIRVNGNSMPDCFIMRRTSATVYVCGFAFTPDKQSVLLIRKKKPEWQKGKLNGIGGRVEKGESLVAAMNREFTEETGHLMTPRDWHPIVSIQDEHAFVAFYKTELKLVTMHIIVETWDSSEKLGVYSAVDIPYDTIPNLHWLIPLALDEAMQFPLPNLSFKSPVEEAKNV